MNLCFDINICYRIAFEKMEKSCTVQELIDEMSEYLGTEIWIIDMEGDNILEPDQHCKEIVEAIIPSGNGFFDREQWAGAVEGIRILHDLWCFCVISLPVKQNFSTQQKADYCQAAHVIGYAVEHLLEHTGKGFPFQTDRKRCLVAHHLLDVRKSILTDELTKSFQEIAVPGFLTVAIEKMDGVETPFAKIGKDANRMFANEMIYGYSDSIVIVFTHLTSEDEKLEKLKEVDCFCEKNSCLYGYSELFSETEWIIHKVFSVRKAVQIGRKMNPQNRSFYEFDYYTQIVTGCAVDKMGEARYREAQLSALQKEDERNQTEWYCTLKEYLLNRNDINEAAGKLGIHRNTMIYRLQKIREILGIDVNDIHESQKLATSFLLREQEKICRR